MGFLTDVKDLERKNKLVKNLILGEAKMLIIAASGEKGNLEPLERLYEDWECMVQAPFADKFKISEKCTYNLDGSYGATLMIQKTSR